MLRFRPLFVTLAALAAPASAAAVTYTWPGAAPCNTTLAACITAAAAGSVVEIATNGPIDEEVFFSKSLVVRAAPGYRPAFAPTRDVNASYMGASAFNVTFEGLTLTDGDIRLSRGGTGDGNFVVRGTRLLNSDPADSARIVIVGSNTGNLTFDIAENQVDTHTDQFNANSISVSANGPTAAGKIQFNRLTATGTGSIVGIFTDTPAGTLDLDVFANEMRGNFPGGAIRISNSTGGVSAPVTVRLVNNVIVGTGSHTAGTSHGAKVLVGNADIAATAVNNTITATRNGLLFSRFAGATGSITGTVRSNLVAFNSLGLSIDPAAAAAVTNSHNLVFANGFNQFTPGTGTVTADPQLLSTFYPRLRAGSPAINAGDATFIQTLLFFNGLPQVDTDGMRRTITGGASGVDIGAYEFGDTSFVASKASASGNNFAFDHPSTNGLPGVRPLLTKNFSVNDVSNPHAIGAWYFSGAWRAFNQGEGGETMPAGTAMNVLVPGLGGPYGASYAHLATAANISGHFTTLDQSYLNSTSDAIVLATSNWDFSGSGVYNNHHIATGYFGSWFVLNQDFADIPLNAAFNIYAQDPSPNAYVHTVAAHNRTLFESTMLDHPLLNGVACAQVHVTQKVGTVNDHPYDVYYDGGRWHIYNQDLATMPLGIEFYVVVNPRQVFECTDVIFEDGFDS
jgi:hypothetical protein